MFFLSGQEQDTLYLKSYDQLSSLINKNYLVNQVSTKKLIEYYIQKAEKESNTVEELRGLAKFIHLQINTRQFDAFEVEQKKMFALATTDALEQELAKNAYQLGRNTIKQMTRE